MENLSLHPTQKNSIFLFAWQKIRISNFANFDGDKIHTLCDDDAFINGILVHAMNSVWFQVHAIK